MTLWVGSGDILYFNIPSNNKFLLILTYTKSNSHV